MMLPLKLNPAIDENDLQTATQNILRVANPDANAVGVVGETLVFAPVMSNVNLGDEENPYWRPILVDRKSDSMNKNSLSGKATATAITDADGITTSTLDGSWKATAQKDITNPGEYVPHDNNSMQRFAYASNGEEAFAGMPIDTRTGVKSISYNEKARETEGEEPTASV